MAGDSNTITIWDIVTSAELQRLHGHTDWVLGLAFSPDGARLVSASVDQTVRLRDTASGSEVLSLPGVRGVADHVAFAPNGRRIIACESVIRSWEIDAPTASPGPPK